MNNLRWIVCNFLEERGESGACSQTHHLYNFARNIFYRALALFFHIYFCFLVIFLSSQSNSEDFFSEDERLGFLFLGAKVTG